MIIEMRNSGWNWTANWENPWKSSVNCVIFSQSSVYKSVRQFYSKVSLVHGSHRDQYYSQTYILLYYNSVLSRNNYLLQCFQALVHFQGISQCSSSLKSNSIVIETVKEKSTIIHASKLSCDNKLLLIMWFLANQLFRNQSGSCILNKDHTGTSSTAKLTLCYRVIPCQINTKNPYLLQFERKLVPTQCQLRH